MLSTISSYWMNTEKDCWRFEKHWHYIGKSKIYQSLPVKNADECSEKCSAFIPKDIEGFQISPNDLKEKN